ncbi:hypothetical protein KY334_04375, partial [Candidatus Woesearchaeota archaeon]|nr:hypothetical protein [Candidatus Woesearchaeota archaeon]
MFSNLLRRRIINIILFMFIISIIGSAILNQEKYITGNAVSNVDELNEVFNSDGVLLWNPSTQDSISSVGISGEVTGMGYYEISLVDGANEYLIYASSVENSTDIMDNNCLESCDIIPGVNSDKYFLRVNIEGDVSVNLDNIHYLTKGSSQEFVISSVAGETCTPESATECETGSERILTCTNTGYGLDWTATTDC